MQPAEGLTIREIQPASNTYAVYGVPYQPDFMVALPVFFFAVLSTAGEDDEVMGLIAYGGEIVPADELPQGFLVGYYRDGADNPAYVDMLKASAKAAGTDLFERLYPQAKPQPILPPPVADGANPTPRRSRRRRRHNTTPAGEE